MRWEGCERQPCWWSAAGCSRGGRGALPGPGAAPRSAGLPHTFKGRGRVGGAMEGGIDEAGRGPGFGPLVVAGVACADPEALRGLGCRDSKLLSPPRRERLARLVRDLPEADRERLEHRLTDIASKYDRLSEVYQASKEANDIPLN